ncbi:hypothetical protein PG994_007056 [Apiospora phragmitis]|uniref:Uncharacterized protein n=1 Tax=Apiospora phragmitis TaxID=2905665 RepID=A0ABR1UZU0_9PEZI
MIPSRPSSSSSSSSATTAFMSSPISKSPLAFHNRPKSSKSPLTVKNSNSHKGKSSPLRYLPSTPPPPSSRSSARRSTPVRPRPSKTLPRALENELRVLAFDFGDGAFSGDPTLIVGNPDTNCHAVFWAKPDRTEFVFHHGRLKEKADPSTKSVSASTSGSTSGSFLKEEETTNDDKQCGCMVRGAPETSTLDIPPRLDEYRLELILGIGRSGIKMEPKLAAMVVMKLFLGMEVPEVLRMRPSS